MSKLTDVGAAYLASLIFPETFYLGWGDGETWWDSNQNEVFQFTSNLKTLAHPLISSVVIKSLDDVTTYALTTDYTVNATTGVLTRNPSGAMANATNYRAYYFASRPVPTVGQTDLVNFLGLLKVTNKTYVTPDVAGLLSTGDGEKWTASGSPTPYIYLEAGYDYIDESDKVIREIGVFADVTLDGGLPGGQTYFPPADISDQGTIINVENIAPITRSVSNKGIFSVVLRFADAS